MRNRTDSSSATCSLLFLTGLLPLGSRRTSKIEGKTAETQASKLANDRIVDKIT